MPKEWLRTLFTIMEDQYHVTAILRAFAVAYRTQGHPKITQTPIYGDREQLYLFLDNCSIHHTKAVQKYIDSHKDRLTIIWNATYAPNLNLIERFWGHLKRSAIHNYYFETVQNLEKAIMRAVRVLNRQKDHPLRLHLQTVQALLKAA